MYAEAETNGVLFQGNDAILRTVGVMQPGIQVKANNILRNHNLSITLKCQEKYKLAAKMFKLSALIFFFQEKENYFYF